MACLEQLLRAGDESIPRGGIGGALLTATEAESIVERLKASPREEFGSPHFLEQHDWIVQLNLQAHHNAAARSDEFVMEALVSHGKVDVLIHSLLVAEAWRERVFPLLREHLARRVDSAISWSLLFHETALANLLEVALFHRCACEAASEDMLLELADWAYRKLTYLNTDAHKHSADTAKDRSARQLLDLGPEEHLDEQLGEVTWGAGMCGLTIMRYLAEHLGSLPLGVMARLVSANDTIMALMPLVAQPPWARTHKGKMERYIQGYWQVVEPADRLQLALPDAQVWLALHNLLLEPACRAKYDPDEYRREALQKLRRHMHEPLLDQLPVLKDLQRLLDEMAVGADSGAHDTRLGSSGDGADQGISYRAGGGGARNGRQAAHLILEQVPTAREAITRGRDWPALAAHIRERWLGDEARRLARKRAEHMLKSFEFMCSLEPEGKQRGSRSCSQGGGSGSQQGNMGEHAEGSGGAGAEQGAPAVQIECWRRVRSGVHERWCEFSCKVDEARAPEPVVVAGDGGSSVAGERFRLSTRGMESTRPLPCDGKIVVRYCGCKAEAQLQLPSMAVRTHDDTPLGLWLTVGLLATDGLALQLRLKRAAKPVERDPVAGVWYVYHPVGGAITMRVKQADRCGARVIQ